jgi:hypothetical protein
VFSNAAPFIRVRAGEVAALANYEFDALDDSRIHPEREVRGLAAVRLIGPWGRSAWA